MRAHLYIILVNSDYINITLLRMASARHMKNLLKELIKGSLYWSNIIIFYFNSKDFVPVGNHKVGYHVFHVYLSFSITSDLGIVPEYRPCDRENNISSGLLLCEFLVTVKILLKFTIQWISVDKTNHTINWIAIYPVASVIHLSNNWGQKGICLPQGWTFLLALHSRCSLEMVSKPSFSTTINIFSNSLLEWPRAGHNDVAV